jgi:hypothetical protein
LAAIIGFAAIIIGTSAVPQLHAQGGAAAPQFQSDYPFADTAQCANSASANCRRKPRGQPQREGAASPLDSGSGPVVRVRGDATALRLDLRRTTIADALSALNRAFGMSYRSSIVLDEEINGSYVGSLRRVIAHVLDGYNYVLRQDGATLDVVVFSRRGERLAPAPPTVDPFHPGRERRRPQLFGDQP